MPSTTSFDFGDVFLVPFPFTNLQANKKRPAVVVSSARYNAARPDLVLMPVTSQVRTPLRFGEVLLEDWEDAGLLKPSVLKPVFFSFQKSLVLDKLGALQPEDLQALRKSIPLLLG